jgi:hypothetical protein
MWRFFLRKVVGVVETDGFRSVRVRTLSILLLHQQGSSIGPFILNSFLTESFAASDYLEKRRLICYFRDLGD